MKKKVISAIIAGALCVSLTRCNLFSYSLKSLNSKLNGAPSIVQTYDEESNIIDRIQGKSIDVSTEDKFAIKDKDGKTTSKSSVINLTIGGKSMIHVGSSLVMHEEGLVNVFDEFTKKVDLKNIDSSTPFINRMVNDMKNLTTGKSKVILVRSQSGKPLATFVGNDVSYFATEIDKSTGILIDDKYLFIYRCDYTIYDIDLLK